PSGQFFQPSAGYQCGTLYSPRALYRVWPPILHRRSRYNCAVSRSRITRDLNGAENAGQSENEYPYDFRALYLQGAQCRLSRRIGLPPMGLTFPVLSIAMAIEWQTSCGCLQSCSRLPPQQLPTQGRQNRTGNTGRRSYFGDKKHQSGLPAPERAMTHLL